MDNRVCWDLHLRCPLNDWEVGMMGELLDHLESVQVIVMRTMLDVRFFIREVPFQ